tara:strand:- start:62 stop:577 length:516 start_codon:yes stop_codon:yes gene_type:complete
MNILKQNFFELFDIDIAIDISKTELDQKVKVLQTKFHPDNFANSSDLEKRLALQLSSHINDGYKILSDLVLRVEYILKINNFVKDESMTINDADFLQEQIEYNELVELLEEKYDDNLAKDHLNKVKLLLKSTIDDIRISFKSEDFEEVWKNLSKLRFYTKNINNLIHMRMI